MSHFGNKGFFEIVLATTNRHKIEEICQINPIPSQLRCITAFDVLHFPMNIEETGATLEENAFIKAKTVFDSTGFACLSDDSGLEVKGLAGAPGVYSARFAGEPVNEGNNRKKLLNLMESFSDTEREARFRTVLCYMDPLRTLFFEGTIRGHITTVELGMNGFGYDSLFIPQGAAKTFAEMNNNEKNAQSHRYYALRAFFSTIPQYLSSNSLV